MTAFDGIADPEETPFTFLPENLSDIPGSCQTHLGMVLGNGFHRFWSDLFIQNLLEPLIVSILFLEGIRSLFHHQCRHHFQVGVEGLTVQQFRQVGGQAVFRLLIGKARVGGTKLQICHQPVKQPAATFDHHKSSLLHGLGWYNQARLEIGFQSTADNVPNRFLYIMVQDKILLTHLIPVLFSF